MYQKVCDSRDDWGSHKWLRQSEGKKKEKLGTQNWRQLFQIKWTK